MKYTDPDGRIAFCVVTAGLGALVGATYGAVKSYQNTGKVDWGEVGRDALIGASIGLVGGGVGATVLTGSATASFSTVVGTGVATTGVGVTTASTTTATTSAIKELPKQIHHFATNKHSEYTPKMQAIASEFGLDLNGDWNKGSLPHQGRHPNAYNEFVLENMKKAKILANGSKEKFLEYFNKFIVEPVTKNPKLLRSEGWEK